MCHENELPKSIGWIGGQKIDTYNSDELATIFKEICGEHIGDILKYARKKDTVINRMIAVDTLLLYYADKVSKLNLFYVEM